MKHSDISPALIAAFAFATTCWLFMVLSAASDLAADRTYRPTTFVEVKGEQLFVSGFQSGEPGSSQLRVGDEILEVDGSPVHSRFQFVSRLVNSDGHARITLSRHGQTLSVSETVKELTAPAMRLVLNIVWGSVAFAMLFLGKQGLASGRLALAFMVVGCLAAANGPNEFTSAANAIILSGAIGAVVPLLFNWLTALETRAVPAWCWWLPWLYFPQSVVWWSLYNAGSPIAAPHALLLHLAIWIPSMIGAITYLIALYRQAGERTRTAIRLATIGVSITVTGNAIGFVAVSITGDLQYFLMASFSMVAVPVAAGIAMIRGDVVDTSRIARGSIVYAGFAVLLGLFAEFVAQPAAGLMTGMFGLTEQTGQTALVVLTTLCGPAAKRWVDERLDSSSQALASDGR